MIGIILFSAIGMLILVIISVLLLKTREVERGKAAVDAQAICGLNGWQTNSTVMWRLLVF